MIVAAAGTVPAEALGLEPPVQPLRLAIADEAGALGGRSTEQKLPLKRLRLGRAVRGRRARRRPAHQLRADGAEDVVRQPDQPESPWKCTGSPAPSWG